MPSRRLVVLDCLAFTVNSAFGILFLRLGGVFVVAGVVVIFVGLAILARGVSRERVLRSGDFRRARVLRFFDSRGVDRFGVASNIAIDVFARSPADLVEDALDVLAASGSIGLFETRRAKRTAKMRGQIESDLGASEGVLAIVPASITPHGRKRLLLYLSIGTYAMFGGMKSGVLTVTDERILFHRVGIGGSGARLLCQERLGEVSVEAWHKGIEVFERSHSVLLLRNDVRRRFRFVVPWFWTERGREVFELIASHATHPPEVLHRFWQLTPESESVVHAGEGSEDLARPARA